MSATERQYATNYREPPIETRFKKGQSGNPRGRPAKNLAALLAAALNEKVTVTENGKRRQVTANSAAGTLGDRAGRGAARGRVVTIDDVVAREPDLISNSWCGKMFWPERNGAAWLPSNSGGAASSGNEVKSFPDLAARSPGFDRWYSAASEHYPNLDACGPPELTHARLSGDAGHQRQGFADELLDELACRELADQASGLSGPERHKGSAGFIAGYLPQWRDDARLQREV
jgi:Family of unknown function (DUF5681)